MKNIFAYDLFVSYATKNKNVADLVVKRLEERDIKCFIAPRDLRTGKEYATEIVHGISNSFAVLLVFSEDSDKSHYVLREVNSAVSRNKTIIPLRIENFLPSEAMEFYLGPTQWLDAFPEVLDIHLDKVVSILSGLKQELTVDAPESICDEGPVVRTIPEVLATGITYKQITMRAIELDFMIASPDRVGDENEEKRVYEEWKGISDYSDAGCVLSEGGEMIGYCDFYPVSNESFDALMSGVADISLDMIDLYALGGVFNGYIAMMAIEPEKASQKKFMMLFDWVLRRIKSWQDEGIYIDKLGAEVYSPMLSKFLEKFGFQLVHQKKNKKLYSNTLANCLANPYIEKIWGELTQNKS